MKVAIAHDYLTQRGGAERVVLSLCRAFPEAEVHTLFHAPEQTFPEFGDRVIRTGPLNGIGVLRRDPRRALPLLRAASSRMRIDADVVVASSSGWAHAFPTRGRRLVYCHSPARWLYLPEDYLGAAGPLAVKRLALGALGPSLRRWDRQAAHAADAYLANSSVVRDRIADVYGIAAQTLFPPFNPEVALGDRQPVDQLGPGGHHLMVARLQPYKGIDAVLRAFADLPDERLVVVGRGPEKDRLRAIAPRNAMFVSDLTDAQLRWTYAGARALIAAGREDFGLTPLEAGAHGVPTYALRAGGYLDSVREGVTGLFFEASTPEAIADAVQEGGRRIWDPARIRAEVESFSQERFVQRIRTEVQVLGRSASSA